MTAKLKVPGYALLLLMSTLSISCREQQSKTSLSNVEINSEAASLSTSTSPKSITRNLIQDRKGNIWMASWEGVFRYDGRTFTNITREESSARFFSLLEDKKGNLWFGSIGAGAYYFDGTSFRNFTIKDGLLNNEVLSIYEDRAGNIWFGVNGGVSRYNGRSFRSYLIKGDTVAEDRTGKWLPDVRPPNEVNAIIEDRTGKYWFATRGNTFVFDQKGFTVFKCEDKAFQNVRTLIEDRKGDIWFGGNDGLWRYHGRTFTKLSDDFGGFIYEDRSGNIWTSSQTTSTSAVHGIVKGNGPGWALSQYNANSLSDKMPSATLISSGEAMTFGILEANDGSIWFGTPEGVKRYDGNVVSHFK